MSRTRRRRSPKTPAEYISNKDDENNFLNFEFALQLNDTSDQLFFSSEKFHGIIDIKLAKVIAASIGRILQ